jgi:hypothetical protein
MKRLAPLTNIIPVIGHADRLTDEEINTLKSAIVDELDKAGIRPFSCERIGDPGQQPSDAGMPFAISSATGDDADNMDASLLMSPDYVQPLVLSELPLLVERIIERDTIAWLRHSAAKKFVHWWRGSLSASLATASPALISSLNSSAYAAVSLSDSSSTMHTPSVSPSSVASGGSPSYALARVSQHMQREDRIAQIRLAKWATELQRSLQNERERYERLARGERAMWLTGRLEECIIDGSVEPLALEDSLLARATSTAIARASDGKGRRRAWGSRAEVNPQDPLGLLHLVEQLQTRGWATVQVVGGLGLIGGLAIWIARHWMTDVSCLTDWDWVLGRRHEG